MNPIRPNSASTARRAEEIFDAAVAAVRDEPLDPQVMAAAQARVARRLDAELAAPAEGETDHRIPLGIKGCDGFQALIPAYLAQALSEPKRILFEDHTRECVPCRRALNEAKKGVRRSEDAATARSHRFVVPRWAMAAGLVAATLAAGVFVTGRVGLFGPDANAKVRAIDGELLLVDGGVTTVLQAGATVERGHVVRTGSGSSAVLALADGTEIELAERTQLELERRSDGVSIDVERGEVIVAAAKQKSGHLYVATDDMTASVVGTIFAVDHGVRGSRVAVLDGEVHVKQGAALAVLRPGDQLATHGQLRRASLEDEFGWSRNSADYKERIAALAALGRELDATLAVENLRTSTRLLDLAPAGTAVWVGLPNLSGPLADAWTLLQQRVAENPVLADWWAEKFGSGDQGQEISDAIERLRSLGTGLGAEIGVAVTLDATGKPSTPIVLAEVVERDFAPRLDAEIAAIEAKIAAGGGHGGEVRRVASPSEATGDDCLYLWLAADDLLVASPTADGLHQIEGVLAAGSSGFAGTPFHARLAEVYADGAGWLLGVDAARVVATHAVAEEESSTFERLGLAQAQQFIVESESAGGVTQSRATLGFSGPRQGVASWLAAPASSEALEFVSANAQFAASALVKRPAAMFDDLWAAIQADEGAGAVAKRDEVEQKLGFSLRDDLAEAFGGDVAFAIDGPWLPKPSWKLIVELADAGRLDFVSSRLVEAINTEAAAHDKPGVRLSQEESDGRRYFRLATEGGVEIAYATVVDGYLVAAPSKALIVEAIAHRAAGTTLVESQAFRSQLPQDVDPDFSAMVWQNLGGTLGQLGQLLSGEAVSPELREQIQSIAAESGPTLVVAYGESDRIGFVAQGKSGPLGFSFEKILSILGAVAGSGAADDAPADETPVRTSA